MRGRSARGPDAPTPELLLYGTAERTIGTLDSPYPAGYLLAAEAMAYQVFCLVRQHKPDYVVIEETNQGRSRFTQKLLEFTHCILLQMIMKGLGARVHYVSTKDWRDSLSVRLTKDDKRQNARLSRAKRAGKKLEGVRGRIKAKRVAVRWANDAFAGQLAAPLIQKDNDVAEALCLGTAWFRGVDTSNGTGW
jgi:hypothetical protein